MQEKQTKSKKRITDHGEVFTAEREVNAMLDLVKQETERIDSRFLEPACGNGNFLVEILRRKLAIVHIRYGKNTDDYERYAVVAVSSIYGVDILADNVADCRKRLFDIFNNEYEKVCRNNVNEETRDAVRFIFQKNILCGDALTMKSNGDEPIVFAEWSVVNRCLIKRRDFRLDEMLEGHENQLTIDMQGWTYDDEVKAMIPLPIREFPPVHYRRVHLHK
jgi:hypothetical protein